MLILLSFASLYGHLFFAKPKICLFTQQLIIKFISAMQRNTDRVHSFQLRLPGIKALSQEKVMSPQSREGVYFLNSAAAASVLQSASTAMTANEFIDKHKTFYNALFSKLHIDSGARKFDKVAPFHIRKAVSVDSSPYGNKSPRQNSLDYVKFNKLMVAKQNKPKNYLSAFDEENRKMGLDPVKMIKGVDDLFNRIERNFDKKTGQLRVPTSLNDWRNQNNLRKSKESLNRSPSGESKKKAATAPIFKGKNILKADKPEPYPLDAPSGYDVCENDCITMKYDNTLEYRLPIILSKAKKPTPLRAATKVSASESGKSPNEKSPIKEVLNTESTVLTEQFERDIFEEEPKKNENMANKLLTFIDKGDDSIKQNTQQRPNSNLYEYSKMKAQAYIRRTREELDLSLVSPNKEKAINEALAKMYQTSLLAPLPIVMNNDNKSFALENYSLDRETSAEIGKYLALKKDLRTIILVENKLSDENAASIISPPVADECNIEILRYVRNQIGSKFVETIEKKFFPMGEDTLRELNIDGCKVSQKHLTDLLNALISARSRIRYLGLSKTGLNEISLKPLGKLVSQSEYLFSLDISWNKLDSGALKKLAKRLEMNRSLRFLNLSWNSLTSQDNFIANKLKNFTSSNPNLVLLNLYNTGLTDFEAMIVLEGVKASINMMSVHLGGNAISQHTYPRFLEFLQSKDKHHRNYRPFKDDLNRRLYNNLEYGIIYPINSIEGEKVDEGLGESVDLSKVEMPPRPESPAKSLKKPDSRAESRWFESGSFTDMSKSIDSLQQLSFSKGIEKKVSFNDEENKDSKKEDGVKDKKEELYREKLEEIRRSEQLSISSSYRIKPNPSNLIFSRILDTRINRDSGQWVENYNCWITEKWRKVHITFKIPKEMQKPIQPDLEKLKQQDDQPKENKFQRGVNKAMAMLAPMTMKRESKHKGQAQQPDDIDASKYMDFHEQLHGKIIIVGTITLNQPVEMIYNRADHSYNFLDYAAPGIHKYKVLQIHRKNEPDRVLLDTDLVVKPRTKEIKPIKERVLNSSVKFEFFKDRSVFADFRSDFENVFIQAYEKDSRFTKIPKVVDKKDDLIKVQAYLVKNYQKIKDIYLHYISNFPRYPYLSFPDFMVCVKHGQMLDDRLTQSDIERAFHLTNIEEDSSEGEEQEENPENLLCRFEFVEIMVRIAVQKFYEKRRVDTMFEAVVLFFEEHFFKHCMSAKEAYYNYREEVVYKSDIDYLFKANIDNLQKVELIISSYLKIYRQYKHALGVQMDDVLVILKAAKIDVADQVFIRTFALSKMTIIDEEREGPKYKSFIFPELLEFLVRLADVFVKNGTIVMKLGLVLAKILEAYNMNFYNSLLDQ